MAKEEGGAGGVVNVEAEVGGTTKDRVGGATAVGVVPPSVAHPESHIVCQGCTCHTHAQEERKCGMDKSDNDVDGLHTKRTTRNLATELEW